ncbi:hypothetical protein HMSSN036_28830 [Paenibacillus macerans]|nr:hypothetical protein HMSSN036_28830 [Paenibacillus macerans]
MPIYTRTGDQGQTSVIGGRVDKDDDRIEAYGTIDELNSFVGVAASLARPELFSDLREQLVEIQQELFDCGSDLAYVKLSESRYKVGAQLAERLETWIDRYEAEIRRWKGSSFRAEPNWLRLCTFAAPSAAARNDARSP